VVGARVRLDHFRDLLHFASAAPSTLREGRIEARATRVNSP
jgi:hypothetical protein